ncbi:MAG: hypothetical protein L0287_06305 [Anaerolineae bacterium]|nr:hypothetical protein [Anaerolineae bacterium]MCI0610394.1 hypothetical protein [Anaerolineae bacterium]
MNQDHVSEREPRYHEVMECFLLVGKVMVEEDGKFTDAEIQMADDLLGAKWNPNVRDFLHVIAGSAHPGIDLLSEARGALVFRN